ncbi:type II toxin-antitoxin system HicB family antitoxin [Chitinophaga sp. XS-30]|uniref:type II toxin-antitoxin system HicB family antitoxin n=1 Tax=Chitinophaga sp. XS-30 TaxID=2604421 RepID=UPI0011DD6731|nr:hypothetical protein [Chitinophaga sp. XS-30]QEH43118.1 hypothetical protein FW415_20505 [Chitinophaga sp. XS-30]
MKKKPLIVVVEASSTGFGTWSEDLPGITGYAKTIPEAKKDFADALQAVLDVNAEEGTPDPALNDGNFEYIYKYDLPSIFAHFGMLDVTNFAKRIGLNASLLRQYKAGLAIASERQKKRIEKGLHDLGQELLNVRL